MTEWIKCSERMPEVDCAVLTWNGDTIQVDCIDPDGFWYEQDYVDITHWQPLPEPPTEDE